MKVEKTTVINPEQNNNSAKTTKNTTQEEIVIFDGFNPQEDLVLNTGMLLAADTKGKPAQKSVQKPVQKAQNGNKQQIYTVKKDDNLTKIAKIYGLTAKDIAAANNINEKDVLSIGQKLKIPNKAEANKKKPVKKPVQQTAQKTSQTKQDTKFRGKIKSEDYITPTKADTYWKTQLNEVQKLIEELKSSEGIYNEIYLCDGKIHIGMGHLFDQSKRPICLKEIIREDELVKKLNDSKNATEIRNYINQELTKAKNAMSDENMKGIPLLTEGLKVTNEQIELLLAYDIIDTQDKLKKSLGEGVYDKLSEKQKKVILDLFYNVRYETLKKSTFLELVNKKDFVGAQGEMNFFGKPPQLGLIKRRYKNMLDWDNNTLTKETKAALLKGVKEYCEKNNKTVPANFEECQKMYLDKE